MKLCWCKITIRLQPLKDILQLMHTLFLLLVDIFNEKSTLAAARLNLTRWYNEVEDLGNNEFNKVLKPLRTTISPS